MSTKLDLMRSGVITLPGGIDTSAHLLFIFPVHSLSLIHIRYSGAHLMTLVQQYLEHVPASLKGRGFSFLIDMSSLNKDSVQVVIEAVEKIQCENPHLVSSVYAIAPKNKESQKMLKKLTTANKSSKKTAQKVSFQTVVVNNKSELNSHIDPHQRTPDYGGTLRYSHPAYMRFVQTCQSLQEKIHVVQYKLAAAQDKVLMLQEYEIPSRVEAREALLTQITNKYHSIMRDLDIESCIDECRLIIEKLRTPEKEPEFTEIMMSPFFGVAKDILEIKHKELTNSRQGLQALWQQAEERVSSSSKIGKYRAKAEKVLEWLDEIGFPTVRQEVEVGECLSKAELYKHHFETGFHSVAQNVMWLAEKLIKKLESCVLQDKHGQEGQNMLEFSRTFHTTVCNFKQEVEAKRQLYENVHQFFLTSDKQNNNYKESMEFLSTENIYKALGELSLWYERCLTFLPFHLLSRHTAHSTDLHHPPQDVFYPSEAWVRALENYLMYNPCPKPALLNKLKNILPVIDNLSVRNQARILVHRIEVLSQVMSHPKQIPTMHQELSDILRWKASIKQDMDDVLFDLTHSSLGGATLGNLDSRMPSRFGGSDSTGLHKMELSLPHDLMPSTLSLNRSHTPSVGSLDGNLTLEKPSGKKSKDRPKKPKRKNLAMRGYKSIESLDDIDGKGSSGNLTPEGDSAGSKESSQQPSRSQTPAHLHIQAPTHSHNSPEHAHFHNSQGPAHFHMQAAAHVHSQQQQRSVTPGALKQQMLARAARKAANSNTGSGTHYGSAPNIASGELRVTFEDHLGPEEPISQNFSKSRSVSNPHIPKLDLSFLQSTRSQAKQDVNLMPGMTHTDSQQQLTRQRSYKVYGESRRKLTNSSTSSGSYLCMDSILESSDGFINGALGQERYVSLDVPQSPKTAPVQGQNFWGNGQEKQEQKIPKTKRTRSSSPKYYAKLLANEKGDLPLSLTLTESGGFDLTKSNIETVVKSSLNAEEKLTIMSSMCEVHGSKGQSKHSDTVLQGKTGTQNGDMPAGDLKPNEIHSDILNEHKQIRNGVDDKTYWKKAYSVDLTEYQEAGKETELQVSANKTMPKSRSGGINRKDRKAVKKKNSVKMLELQIPGVDTDETSGKSSNTALESKPLTVPVYKNVTLPYGIDIEAWIDRQHSERYNGDQSVDSSAEVTSSTGTEVLEECRVKFQQARANRLHEEQLLEKERRRLQDLEIEQQAAKQAEVERALRRTERILQEQEQKIQSDAKRMTGSKFQNTPETVAAAAPPVVHVRTNSTGNASEESGIFTQTSQDSVARTTADSVVMATQSGMTFVQLTNRSDPQSSRDEVTYSSSKSDWDSAFDNIMNADTTMMEHSEVSFGLTNEIAGGAYSNKVLEQDTEETSDTEDSQAYEQSSDFKVSEGDLTATTSFYDDGTENIIVSGLPPSSVDFSKSEACTTESNCSFSGTVQSISNDSERYEEKASSTVTELSTADESEFLSPRRESHLEDSPHRKTRQSSQTRKNPLLPRGISPELQLVEISLEELANHKLKDSSGAPASKSNPGTLSNTRQVDFRDMLKQAKKHVRAKRNGSSNSETDFFSSLGKGKNHRNVDLNRINSKDVSGTSVDSLLPMHTSQSTKSSQFKDGSGSKSRLNSSKALKKTETKQEITANSNRVYRQMLPESHVETDTKKFTGKTSGEGVGFIPVVAGGSLNPQFGDSGGGSNATDSEKTDLAAMDSKVSNLDNNNQDKTIVNSVNNVYSNRASSESSLGSKHLTDRKTEKANVNQVMVASTPRTNNALASNSESSQHNNNSLPCVSEEELHAKTSNDTDPEEMLEAADSRSEMSQGEVMLESDLNDTMLSSILGFDQEKCVSDMSTDLDDTLDYKEEETAKSLHEQDDYPKPLTEQMEKNQCGAKYLVEGDSESFRDQEENVKPLTEQDGDGKNHAVLEDEFGSYYMEEDTRSTDSLEDDDARSLPELEVYSYMQDLQNDVIEEEEADDENEDNTLNESAGFLSESNENDRELHKNTPILKKDMITLHEDLEDLNHNHSVQQIATVNVPDQSRSVLDADSTGDLQEVTSSHQEESFQIKGLSTQEFLDINDCTNVCTNDTTTEDLSLADSAPTETCLDDTLPTETCLDDTLPTDTCLDDTLPSGVAFLTELVEENSYEESEDGVQSSGLNLQEVVGGKECRMTLDSGEGRMVCSASPSPACFTSEVISGLKTPVIIDNGSGMCKCGFAGEDQPTATFPAYVGRPKYSEIMSKAYRDCYVGEAAQNMRGMLQLKYPLEHGIITDWNDMEKIWEHAFSDQLRVDPSEHPVLLTEAPLNSKRHRERMLEMMFETFQVPAFYVSLQALLALYASGRTTGVVLDIGDGVSHVVPVYEGYSLPHAIQRLDLAGRDLTHFLMTLMYNSGYSFTTTAERDIARDIKERLCYVASDYKAELKHAEQSAEIEGHYSMPDGRVITLGAERFRCTEALFQPSLLGREHGGIHQSIYQCVSKCDLDLRRELLNNIVLSGGSTLFEGLAGRLHSELGGLYSSDLTNSIRISSPDDRRYLVWRGASVLADMPSFASSWVLSEEYEEYGTEVVHRKCF